MSVPIEQSRDVGPHSKEKGVSEIHLAGKTREQIPARRQYGEDTGESQDAHEIGIFGEHGQEKKKEKKKDHSDPGWEDDHLIFEHGEQLPQVK
jgi:hypothetical protein